MDTLRFLRIPNAPWALLATLFVFLGQWQVTCAQDATHWERYREALQGHPQMLRYYRFDQVSRDAKEVLSEAGEPVALRPNADQRIRRVPADNTANGNGAVFIDDAWFEAPPFSIPSNGFTIEIRFRKQGPGKRLGNGRANGMLLAQGSGYWDGWRLWTSYPDNALRFEIGRAKPSQAFGMSSQEALPDGVWHHLAASWDGGEMRLYVNGVLTAAAVYEGAYVVGTSPLKIGYANSGIGSLKMDVQEVAVFRGALSPADILAHACLEPRLSDQLATPLLAATHAVVQSDWPDAANALAQIADSPDAAVTVKAAARLAWARVLRRQGIPGSALQICAQLFENEAVPESWRAVALRNCLPTSRDAIGELQSASIYEKLLALKDLSPAQQFLCHMGLAECWTTANQTAAAQQQYQQALTWSELNDLERREIELQMAHSLLHAESYVAARKAYSLLASNQAITGELRALAALGYAHCFEREKKYGQAAATYRRIAQEPTAPAHLRREAEQRAGEWERVEQGLPARDPAANRVQLPPRAEVGKTFHVSPVGDDANPGTREKPLASLEGARDAIRHWRAQADVTPSGVEVIIGPGVYPRRSTFVLTDEDSGSEQSPVIYRAAPDATPRFVGGVVLEGFQSVTDRTVLERLDPAVRDRVVSLDLRTLGVSDFGSLEQRGYGYSGYPTHPWTDLYVAGRAMQLARWPNDRWLEIGKVQRGGVDTDQSGQPGQFEYQGVRPQGWKETSDIWMFGAWGHLWEGTSVQVARLDADRRSVTTRQRATYGFREGYPFYFFNVLEEIDQPGEWYLDRSTGVVYLLPPEGVANVVAEFPLMSEPMVTLRGASYVTLEGLTFELGRTDGLVMDGGSTNLLAGCTFRRFGGNGLVIRNGSGHGVLGCDLYSLGAGGVRLDGGDYKTLKAGKNFVENCHIYDFSRVDRVYAPAVHLDGVGNRIAHNLMHDSPHHAMRVEGFEHAIEFNEVHSVVYEYDDQAGIDIYGNPAYRGITIEHNFWHHIGSGYNVAGQAGIRLDDFISSVLIYGNVFYRCAGGRFGGVQIHGGKDNIADNNLFIDCQSAFSFSPWGEKRWLEQLDNPPTRQAIRRGGMDITSPPHSERYPDLATLPENADRNYLWRNLAVACGQFRMGDRGVNVLLDNHSFAADPGFVDPAQRDFTLAEDSPLFARFPFRPIPFQEIGLYQDPYRATWPVEHQVTERFHQD